MLQFALFFCFGCVLSKSLELCEAEGGTCVKTSNCSGWIETFDLGCGNLDCCKPAPVTINPDPGHPGNSSCGYITRINSNPKPLLRVVGGEPALEGEWPWQVAILDKAGKHFCGGTLISPEFVVSAAHCFVIYTEADVVIVVGEHHLVYQTGNEVRRNAHIVVKHTGYSTSNYADDIAFIQLDSPVDISGNYVRAACLPTPDELDYAWSSTDKCFVTGWGSTHSSAIDNDWRHLQHVRVSITSQSICSSAWNAVNISITEKQICAGTGTFGTCEGDSGGPLVCERNNRYYLVGVTSFGHAFCNGDGLPDVYTRLSSYFDWMNSYILLLKVIE